MKSATLSIKIDPALKDEAQKVAHDFGMQLGTLVGVLLKDVVRTKELHLDAGEQFPAEQMTPQIEKIIAQAEKEIKNGEVSPDFDNVHDFMEYLLADDDQVHQKVSKATKKG